MEEHIEEVRAEFSELHQKHDEFEELQKPRYVAGFAVYASFALQVLPTIVILLLLAIFMSNTAFVYTSSPTETALYLGSSDVNGIVIVDEALWEESFKRSYQNIMIEVGEKDGYLLLMNSYSSVYNTEQFQSIGGLYVIKAETLDGILDGSITTWSTGADISLYIPDDHVPAFASTLITNGLDLIPEKEGMTSPLFESLAQTICYVILATVMILIFKPSIKYDFNLLQTVPKSDVLSQVGIGILYVIAAGVVAGILAQFINWIANTPNEISLNQLAINRMIFLNPLAAVLMVITAVVIGPIVEELAFRKAMFGLIKNQRTAMIVSSILFGVIHITSELILGDFLGALTSGIAYIAAGFAFAYIYIKSKKNIHVSILAHMGYNLFSIIMLFM